MSSNDKFNDYLASKSLGYPVNNSAEARAGARDSQNGKKSAVQETWEGLNAEQKAEAARSLIKWGGIVLAGFVALGVVGKFNDASKEIPSSSPYDKNAVLKDQKSVVEYAPPKGRANKMPTPDDIHQARLTQLDMFITAAAYYLPRSKTEEWDVNMSNLLKENVDKTQQKRIDSQVFSVALVVESYPPTAKDPSIKTLMCAERGAPMTVSWGKTTYSGGKMTTTVKNVDESKFRTALSCDHAFSMINPK